MSAYIVEKEHINAMLMAALSVRQPTTWRHNEQRYELTQDILDKVGQMLLDENVASVQHRYPSDTILQLPGKINAEWLLPFRYSPITSRVPTKVEAIKLVHCYKYQSCEHPGWKTSEAKAFCESLEGNLVREIPGYDEAPWGWEKE